METADVDEKVEMVRTVSLCTYGYIFWLYMWIMPLTRAVSQKL